MTLNDIRSRLIALKDEKYGDFSHKTIPTVERMIGVRTPLLRALAGELAGDDAKEAFLKDLPHTYFEEYQLHAFVIALEKDIDKCLESVEAFLPFIDNWATCDQLNPKVFSKHHDRLLPCILRWTASENTYTRRFGIKMLMDHFLDEDFDAAYPQLVADVHSDEYYINMMCAWYFATALAKQYERVLPYITERRLDTAVHKKTIQKAVESYRMTEEQKQFLKGYR